VHGKSGETYNVGSGQAVAVQDVLDLILSLTEVKPRIETDKGRLRPVDMPVIAADARKLVAATGWVPHFTMQRTVADILADWRAKV
jgi:GDP-4-dehydro-6-deoxy-D-mannose reductase